VNRCRGRSWYLLTMTSGGAESWDAQLAKYLHGKKVIVMPDADAAGEKFAAKVIESLDAERIEYRVVTFADSSAKDVTEFLAEHTVEDLVRRLGTDWVRMPDGRRVQDSVPESETLEPALAGEITI
jgi:DNA primase